MCRDAGDACTPAKPPSPATPTDSFLLPLPGLLCFAVLGKMLEGAFSESTEENLDIAAEEVYGTWGRRSWAPRVAS